MKRYSVSQARIRIAEVLDSAERGESVLIERQGVRFQVILAKTRTRGKRVPPVLKILDPAVARGDWTWDYGPAGLTFVPGTSR